MRSAEHRLDRTLIQTLAAGLKIRKEERRKRLDRG
jgi:hypothetical protein